MIHKNSYEKRLHLFTKRIIALQALQKEQTISALSRTHGCSRTTVYKQQDKALTAANKAFDADDAAVLFYFPVTKKVIEQIVISLFSICKSSFRDIIFFLKTIFDYSLSLGSIFTILECASTKAACINQSYALNTIQTSAADELFHRNKPFLAVVDIESRFCPILVKAERRDYETWGVHLLDLQDRGYAPTTTLLDGAKELVKGHETVLPNTKIRHDYFHMLKDLNECNRFLKNKVASSTTAVLRMYQRLEHNCDAAQKQTRSEQASAALAHNQLLENKQKAFSTLVQWMQHDVLQLAGHNPSVRAMLYDFIVSEMTLLAEQYPHRISTIVTSLNTRRDALLDVSNALNDKFLKLSNTYGVSIDIIWKVCYSTRYAADSIKYGISIWDLEGILGDHYDEIEDAVLSILEGTHRCSSMVENLNSRLRPYLDEQKEVTQKTLGLIQFYLNHKPFMRSHHAHLVKKTPAEALTGEKHKPWLEMLGYKTFKQTAA